MVAINLRFASIPDNEGNQPQYTPILTKGDNAYFTTLPVKKIVEELKNANIPSALSYSAGVFVCNQVLYRLLHHYKDTKVKVGFIHLPFLPEQTDGTKPSMPKEQMIKALTIAIQSI